MEAFRLFLFYGCCLLIVGLAYAGNKLDFLRLPEHDGVSRTCRLTQGNLTTIINDAQTTTVVFFNQNEAHRKCHTEGEAEVLSQALSNSGIRICLADLDLQPQGEGDVVIYTGGRKLPYFGRKSAAAILSYLLKVDSAQVRVITGKLDKVAFDAVQEPKLVGLFMNGTADFLAYQEASRVFSPSFHFYSVFDRTVAKHLKLEIIGEVQLYKPLHKTPVVCPQNPAALADLQAFLQEQRGAALTRLTEHNVNDPLIEDPSRILVVAIAEQTSPLGGYLYKLLYKALRNNTNNTEFNKMNLLWVEPDLFPSVYLNAKFSANSAVGIPTKFPCLGSIAEASSVWFDMAQINATADKTADEQNLILINTWLQAVLSNTVPTTTSGGRQSFLVQPSSQSVVEGSDFVLECRVQNPVGDCLWLHNGQNLGFNMARYRGVYTWVVPREDQAAAGDCSLKVTGAKAGKQDGQWSCEMTGTTDSPTITSQPAKITISPKGDQKTEL